MLCKDDYLPLSAKVCTKEEGMTNPAYIPSSSITIFVDGNSAPEGSPDKLRDGPLKLTGKKIVIIVQLTPGPEDISIQKVELPTKVNVNQITKEAKSSTVFNFENPDVSRLLSLLLPCLISMSIVIQFGWRTRICALCDYLFFVIAHKTGGIRLKVL